VLVADDETRVGILLRCALRQVGFAVWLAVDGPEAVQLYQRRREQIDLVLLDVCLPGLDGPETLQAMRRIDAQVLCCFMSAYRGVCSAAELAQLGVARFFAKPFALSELVQELWLLTARAEAWAMPEQAPPRECPAPMNPGTERRAAVRYVGAQEISCTPIQEFRTRGCWWGRLRDVSVSGVRLLLNRRFEPGTLLVLDVPGSVGEDGHQLFACVVRVAPGAGGGWELGCTFTQRLTENELRALCS
jgi:DNA-binding response OmpR family regulator